MSLTKHRPSIGRVASGNSRSAENDEPEPRDLSEADLAAIDREFAQARDSGAIQEFRDHQALELQVHRLRCMGGL